MGGTSGEADGSEEVDILAVCMISYRVGGGGTKMAVSWEPLVQLTPNLDTVYLGMCPTTRWCHFHGNDIIGVWTGVQNVPRMHFLAEKQRKIQPGWLSCEGILPECF